MWEKLLNSIIEERDIYLAKIKLTSSFLISNQTLDERLQRKVKLIGYDLDSDFDCLKKVNNINSEEVTKVANKYLAKPFLSIYGDRIICNEIKKLWIKNF